MVHYPMDGVTIIASHQAQQHEYTIALFDIIMKNVDSILLAYLPSKTLQLETQHMMQDVWFLFQ